MLRYIECGPNALSEPERYAADGRWITIGAEGREGGGTHVAIDGQGKILAGPKGMEGQNVSELGKSQACDKAQSGIDKSDSPSALKAAENKSGKDIDTRSNPAHNSDVGRATSPRASSMSPKGKVSVSIVRSTDKAHLVKDESGRQGWIQKRWLSESGHVSAATFERSVSDHEDRQHAKEERHEHEAKEKAFRAASHKVRVAKETDKAIAVEVVITTPGGFDQPKLVWFPKSAIGGGQGVAEIPGWMIRDREDKAVSDYRPSGYYETHRLAKGEDPYLSRGVEIIGQEASEPTLVAV